MPRCALTEEVLLSHRVVDPGLEGPMRCLKYKAYMNPHVTWMDTSRNSYLHYLRRPAYVRLMLSCVSSAAVRPGSGPRP